MSLATSYAKALYAAAKAEGKSAQGFDEIEQQLDSFAHLLDQSKDLRQVLLAPILNAKEKISVIEAVSQKAGYTKLVVQFLILLANKGRLPFFHEVAEAFSAVRLEAEGGVLGYVASAEPIADADVKGLAEAFTRKLGSRVAFRVSTDPALLAGMKVTVGGTTYDGSLKSKLQQIRERVITGASAT